MDHEGLTGSKLGWYGECLKWWLAPKMPYRPGEFSHITPENIVKYFWKRVEWLLIDVDDCIAPAYGDILPQNIEKIAELLDAWFALWILSNGIKIRERTKVLLGMWVKLCTPSVSKPNPQAFVEASQKIGHHPHQVVMLGDDISKDGGALQSYNGQAVLAGYIPVEPIWNSLLNIPPKKWMNFGVKKISRWIANWRNGL